jgi:putative sigma-54 modulation protein
VQLAVTGRHIELTDRMKQYGEEKARKLTRFYDRIERIELVLERESAQYRVELVVRADHKNVFVAHVDAGDYYEAVDLVLDKMEGQLRRHKERHRNRKHPAKPSSRSAEAD